jgi:hypothetical protein
MHWKNLGVYHPRASYPQRFSSLAATGETVQHSAGLTRGSVSRLIEGFFAETHSNETHIPAFSRAP